MTLQQLIVIACAYLTLLVVVIYFTRPILRRITGALAGGAAGGCLTLIVFVLGDAGGLWRAALPTRPSMFLLLYIGAAISWAPFYLIMWRVARRFGRRGLTVFLGVAAIIGPPRDYLVAAKYPEWMVFAPGIAPILADALAYVGILVLGYAVMRLVAGPARARTLANIAGVRRIHAFEFHDLSWFPISFRNALTNYLQFVANRFDIYKNVLPVIEKGILSSGNNTIVDIASGGGGGLVRIAEHLKSRISNLKIVLTDYYPNIDAFKRTKAKLPDVFDYVEDSVNAMDVPQHLKGFRTQFLSFHHFRPKDAKAILQNAIDSNQAIGIFEAQQRDVKNLAGMLLSPLSVLLLTPFIKPFRFNRIIFTYLIPVLPLFTLWDGVISVLRTYTKAELKQMAVELRNNASFDWEIDIVKTKSYDILYLLGTPIK